MESGAHRYANCRRHCALFAPALSKPVLTTHWKMAMRRAFQRFGVDRACHPA